MKISRRQATIGSMSLLAGTTMSTMARAQFGEGLRDLGEGIDDFVVAQDAYIYGYPLVTMEMTRRIITNVASVVGTRGPMGQLIKLRQYPDASFRDVTAPNADTLYTSAFIDVGKEPWVLGIPDMKDRYYLFPMLDGWTDVFQVPGKRTTGTGAQTYAITGPGWKGTLPTGVKEYKSPTSIVWILGRIYCTGTPEDYAAVHALQDQCTLVPLSAYGKPYTPAAGIDREPVPDSWSTSSYPMADLQHIHAQSLQDRIKTHRFNRGAHGGARYRPDASYPVGQARMACGRARGSRRTGTTHELKWTDNRIIWPFQVGQEQPFALRCARKVGPKLRQLKECRRIKFLSGRGRRRLIPVRNERRAKRTPMLFSPTIGAAITPAIATHQAAQSAAITRHLRGNLRETCWKRLPAQVRAKCVAGRRYRNQSAD